MKLLDDVVKEALIILEEEGEITLHFTDGDRSNKGYQIERTATGYLYSWGRWDGNNWQSDRKDTTPDKVLREKLRKGYEVVTCS